MDNGLDLQKIIKQYYRQLQLLKEKEAIGGYDVSLILQREDVENEIAALERKLALQKSSTTKPQVEHSLEPTNEDDSSSKFNSITDKVEDEVDDNLPTPIIENRKFLLPDDAKMVLKKLYATYHKVVVRNKFSGGLGGCHIFTVRSIDNNNQAKLPEVVKLGPTSFIEREWNAYKNYIEGRMPGIAKIDGRPVLLHKKGWGGIRYTLMGESGTFEVKSFHQYYLDSTIEDIEITLNRLFRRLAKPFEQGFQNSEFAIKNSYDRILPPNLVISQTTKSKEPQSLTPSTAHFTNFNVDDYVSLEGFIVTEIDPEDESITLNSPNHQGAYRIRLKHVDNIKTYHLGKTIKPIKGIVTEIRAKRLRNEVEKVFGFEIRVTSETVFWSNGPQLKNPLKLIEMFLKEHHDIKIAYIHGDLNMENILVNLETKDTSIIDFGESRKDHVLHDFLKLETSIVTKIIAPLLHKINIPPHIIYDFYRSLHVINQGIDTVFPKLLPAELKKPWVIIKLIRKNASKYFFRYGEWREYYIGLVFYLMGTMKFKDLNETKDAPYPKKVAFWGAATIGNLLENPNQVFQYQPETTPDNKQKIDKNDTKINRVVNQIPHHNPSTTDISTKEHVAKEFDMKKIYNLLADGFSNVELRRFCKLEPSFEAVHKQLATGTGTDEIIDKIIDYADKRELFEVVLAWAKEENDVKYQKHSPYY